MIAAQAIRVPATGLAGRGPDLRPADEALRFVAVYRVDCDAAQWSDRAALRALGGDAGSGADAGARATQDGPRRRRKALLRACTRWLLGAHLGLRGDEVVLGRGLNGRPRLERPGADARLAFSTSLCGRDGVVAVSSCATVGIDVERAGPDRFPGHIAAHLLHRREMESFAELAYDERTAWLARVWACKEAALKALGLGLDRDPREVEIGRPQAGPGAAGARFTIAGEPALDGRLLCEGALVCALVTREPAQRVTCLRLRPC